MVETHTPPGQEPDYIWGHGQEEFERLIEQGRFLGESTEHLLRLAGIKRGMRVLDVGSGAGDVSLLAARLVGPEGAVIGVDNSSEAIAVARERAQRAGLANVHFIQHDLANLPLEAPVDVVVGRLVLFYFADAAALIRSCCRTCGRAASWPFRSGPVRLPCRSRAANYSRPRFSGWQRPSFGPDTPAETV